MATPDMLRSAAGAAALDFARRATGEALGRATTRQLAGAPLSALQLGQVSTAETALGNGASDLLIYGAVRVTGLGQPRNREIQALRISKGASEVQKIVIVRAAIADFPAGAHG